LRGVSVLEEHPVRTLVALGVASFAVRFAVALDVRGPLYFHDEYLYTALARAIGHGSLLVRAEHVSWGTTISYFGPLVTAPIWRLHNVDISYRLAQATGTLAFASSGPAAYALARRVNVSVMGGLFVATITLLVPSGVFTATLLSEPYAYPAFLLGMVLAVPAVATPSFRRSAVVVAVALALCLIAGLQFWFFGPACVLAAIAASPTLLSAGRRAAVGVMCAAAALVLLWASGHWVIVQSFEGNVRSLHYSVGTLAAWLGATALVVSVGSGWVTIPGAVLGFARLRRASIQGKAFAFLSIVLVVGFLAEATVYGANSALLYERFAFYCTPLVAIACAAWLEAPVARYRRPVYVGTAYGAAAMALLLPLTGTLDGTTSHTPVLAGLKNLAPFHQGSGQIVWVPILALLSIGVALSGPAARRSIVVVALAVCAVTSLGASRSIINRASTPPTPHLPVRSGAAFLTTPAGDGFFMERTLFWNPSITRVLVLGAGGAPDDFGSTVVTLTTDGLVNAEGAGVAGPFVVGPTTKIWASTSVKGADGLDVVSGIPRAVIVGYVRRRGYLTSFATIVVAGGRQSRRQLTLRVWSTNGRKTLALACNGSTNRIVVGPRPTVVRISAPARTTTSCALRIVRGPVSVVGSSTVSVRARLSFVG
jgi:hypothetical protein